MNKKVIVIMAAYNGSRYISQQLYSIVNQSYKPDKIYINIDKSEDDTLSIVNIFKKKYSNIIILSSNNIYGSAASNFLNIISTLDFSNIDYIALSDQDDIWIKNKLKKAINHLNKGFDGYSSNVEAFWRSGRKKKIIKNQPQTKYDYLFESSGPGCTFVLNRDLIISFQKFLITQKLQYLNNYHDWLIYAFARSNRFKWFIDSNFSLLYRQHDNNFFGANVGLRAFLFRLKKVLVGHGFNFSFLLIRSLSHNDTFLKSLLPIRRASFFYLALNFYSCRRSFFDKFLFFIACIILLVFFPKNLKQIKLL